MTNDYELVYLAQENNEDARRLLFNKYHNYIYKIINSIYYRHKFNTIDIEDIALECKLVLDNAINTFNQDKESKFISYLRLCLHSRLTDLIRKNYTKKSQVETNIKSLDEEINGIILYDTVFNSKYTIEDNYLDIKELVSKIDKKINDKEKIILKLLIEGKKPEEIAIYLNIKIKSIYNTIYRLKVKIKDELN